MKNWFIILGILLLGSCQSRKTDLRLAAKAEKHPSITSKDSVPACYWQDLKREITPNANIIDFQVVKGQYYFLKWGNNQGLTTLPDTFYCDAPSTARPRLVGESKDYLVLRFGCGNPCWGAIFLPLYAQGKPLTVLYQYDYDLTNDLVAYLASDSGTPQITIENLRNGKRQKVLVKEGCESAVPTYCVDSLSIQNKVLYYRWIPKTTVNSKDGFEKRVKIKI